MLIELIILTLLSLLQATFVPIDLVLLVLVCRSFLVQRKSNFYMAFSFGILTSLLQGGLVATSSIFYLVSVELVQVLQKTELSNYWLSILPISLVIFIGDELMKVVVFGNLISWGQIMVELALVLPYFLLLKLWHERFVVEKEVKLKMKG